ncbi:MULTISPECIES: glycerol-3-phosphate dehydrogenase/oxidase [Streptomyces]|uniref:FAD-dependent oxidoreductase n=1 Tax=Streptomyces albidoflavus TaxID=1886 RepID=A0AA37FGZ3_9ACTN|nr:MULTISPECIES: glycerol-3-phosphate dehydrogenase/oxidase [Streptomyces]MBK3380643.1 glycerol-3-phosphate dehydrogenase/oxidase [Streptomyces sp. DEF147AK]MBK3388485.1 glycerol-3-phosphate dehydrogenase/oxidase [Streptomyces sp. DEF1AK]MCO6752429.1 glycerol-3-phosphate dehydrogenase/oxidase [Streptomyces sp. IpFD-1.1]RZE48640.1 FAD-dependent oxidoreductase [Streptomyces albidoflavus]WQG75238.1 glycerol-3-phosphate dehydrogenase/oxidase [Streptomyces albidoflavus]
MITMPARKPRRGAAATRRTPLLLDRAALKRDLADDTYDVLVVGGGVTGAYAVLDAVSRGLRAALVEKDDFASGTSSKSSKMVHGGLRYIEQGNVNLVRHSLLERHRFRRNAPHLVHRLPFLFPVLEKEGVFDARLAKGFEGLLWTYDLVGGWRIGKLHQRLTVPEVLAQAPTLRAENLKGGLMYFDARTDDARLVLTLVRTAAALGATVLNGAKVDSLLTRSGRVCGARIATGEGETLEVRARTVVNATGVWTDQVDSMADEGHRPQVRPAKGVHIVVPWEKVRINCTVTVPIPGRARRATCTRWGNAVVLGTTDEDYQGSADDVHCTRQEMEFLLEGANTAFEGKLGPQDVVGSIGGLRPLVGGKEGATLDMRRDHHITVGASGMVTVTGGKLTTSRHMGELVVDKVMALLGRKGRSRTANLPLLGGAGYDAEAVAASGGLAAHLGERYGTEARFVGDLIAEDPSLAEPVVAGQPYTKAEVVYAARAELARSVDDVLSRRTRARLFARDASAEAAAAVGAILGRELNLTEAEVDRSVTAYLDAVQYEKSVLLEGAAA